MAVEPNHVYVTRPGYALRLEDGRLRLGESVRKAGHREPIDEFFKSLASEQGARAVAIVLSGMGSNGTNGAQAVKASGGLCIAQEPESASYPSMPRSMINRELPDFILRPSEMAKVLMRYATHDYVRRPDVPELEDDKQRRALREVLAIVNSRTRHDFAGYKTPTLLRRIRRRMGLSQINHLEDYARVLRQSPTEAAALADDLLINVTGFFRDAEVWEALETRVIQPLVAERHEGEAIRAWVTACSSGEEAYTLAMLLVEAAEAAGKHFEIKIFATDMADRALTHARRGSFAVGIDSDISPERLERFFVKTDDHYLVKQELREMIVFAPQNVLSDPPFSRLDICTCRNLLIYLQPDGQKRLLHLLHFGLREGGTLLLGNSETIGVESELFQPIDKKARLFRRVGPTRHGLIEFPSAQFRGNDSNGKPDGLLLLPRVSIAQAAQRVLLESHTPAAVVTDAQGHIAYYHGPTERYLSQPRGEPTRDLLTLTREPIRGAVRTVMRRVTREDGPIHLRDGLFEVEGERRRLWLQAARLAHRDSQQSHYLITFSDTPEPIATADTTTPAEKERESGIVADELDRVRAELQSTIEELQTSNEEMKASHEEVTSVNEELQSTNEELETSKEELQSLNEELTTVNAQLGSKAEELERSNSDLASLLRSTDIAVLFLDTTFRIRRFTPSATDLFDLIPTDVDRPLSDLARKFEDPDLVDDVKRVLDKLAPREREVVSASGRVYIRRVLPYRDAANRIDGVVVTFVDISDRRTAVEALAASERRYRDLVGTASVGICEVDRNGQYIYANDRYCELVGRGCDDVVDKRSLFDLTYPDDLPTVAPQMARLFETGEPFRIEKRYQRPDGAVVWVEKFISAGKDEAGRVHTAVVVAVNITDRRRAAQTLHEQAQRLRLATQAAGMGFWDWDIKSGEVMWDAQHNRLAGLPEQQRLGTYEQFMLRVHPDDREKLNRAIQQAVDGGRTYHTDFRVVWPDGSEHWIAGYGQTVVDDAGRAVRMLGSVMDVTARYDADAERSGLLDEARTQRDLAEAANLAKDHFLANVSHELRTPLASILLWIKALRCLGKSGQPRDDSELADGLKAIEESAKSQRNLIHDLLDTARITAGKLRLQREPIQLEPVVRRAIDLITPSADDKNITIHTDFAQDAVTAVADAERIKQVAWNLLSNAVKFSTRGGSVHVRLDRLDKHVELRVGDEGKGINAEFLPRVFDRFGQDPEAEGHGLGLGLAIAHEIVKMHGGTITAFSDGPGRGALFTVTLPSGPPDATASPHPQ